MGKKKNQVSNTEKKGQLYLQQQKIEHYSGIIPHPNIIEGYERIFPGATDRILAMTENDLKHKHEIELIDQNSIVSCRNKALEFEISTSARGQYFGFFIMIMALIGSFVLILKGCKTDGYVTAVSTILLYFGSVMYRNKIQKKMED